MNNGSGRPFTFLPTTTRVFPIITNTSMSKNYRLNPEHLFSELQDEAAILNLATGKYYGINPVGVTIWKAMEKEQASTEVLEAAVLSEYNVDPGTCRVEVGAFLDRMVAEKLIEVVD